MRLAHDEKPVDQFEPLPGLEDPDVDQLLVLHAAPPPCPYLSRVHRVLARTLPGRRHAVNVGPLTRAPAAQCPAPGTPTPVTVARRLASGVLRLRATRTWPSMITHETPGMSPRAIAPRASVASEAAGASQTTRSAGAPTVMVPVPRSSPKILRSPHGARDRRTRLFPAASRRGARL